MNTDAPWPDLDEAELRVLEIQTKLHQWAADDPHRRFCDLYNLVCDPAVLLVAWARVRGNRGARTAGVDGVKPRDIIFGRETLLPVLRADLKARQFVPLPVREKLIPKSGGKLRGLGIPTAGIALCKPPSSWCSNRSSRRTSSREYGFRPKRRKRRNPEDLTQRQEAKLAWIAKVNTRLYRAYLMKEQLRIAIRTKGVLALTMLDEWLAWAQRCRIDAFVELGRKIRKNIAGIEAAMLNNLSNALIESTNTKLRVLHRMAFGFRQPEHLIALALLDRGGYCPPLPGRDHPSAPAFAALG